MARERIVAPGHDRARSLGHLGLAWIEHFCVHGPGDVEGVPLDPDVPGSLPLDDEFAGLVLDHYALGHDGRRLYDSAFTSRPKGRAKSELAALEVLFEAFGPCRFSGWAVGGEVFEWRDFRYVYEPGEPMGRVVTYPYIRCLATEEGQAGNTYDNVYFNLTEGPLSEGLASNVAGLTRVLLPHGGEIVPSTASNAAKDGGKETFVVFDEALALTTPLPTPEGWTTMGDVAVGDYLIGSDGQPVEVISATPVQQDRVCYRVEFEDGTNVIASDGHLWLARVAGSASKPKVLTTAAMVADGRRFRVPARSPFVGHEVSLDVAPYTLGAWLGDGDSRNATVTGSAADLGYIAQRIEHEGYTVKECRTGEGRASRIYISLPGSHRNRFSPVRGLKVRLRDAGLIQNKHIPPEYLRASVAQRLELLRGLMDTDGHVSKTGNCTFATAEEPLASGMMELLRSLGEVPVLSWAPDPRARRGGCFRVTFTPRYHVPFHLARKAERITMHKRGPGWISVMSITPVESVPVRCVAVDSDDHLFCAGDGMHLTHNTHLYVLPELQRMYRTVRRNMAKRKDAEPWSHETSTMYLPGEGSIAEETHGLAKQIRAGRVKRPRLLFDHRQAPDDVDLGDEEQLVAALKEAYGPFAEVMDLRRIVDEIWDPRNLPGDSRRYFLNQPTAADDAYIAAHEWAGCLDDERSLEPDDLITLGFDGSRGMKARGKPDATGLVATRVSDGHQVVLGHWEAGSDREWDSWTPPLPEVDAAVDRAFATYRVAAFYADPAGGWRSQVNAWEAKYGSRLVHATGGRQVRASRSSDHPFEWWMTGGRSEFIQRAIEAYRDAVRNKEMTHGHEQGLTAHVLNARLRIQRQKLVVKKEHDYSPKKVDLCVAALLSWQARLDAIAAGIGAVPKRRAPIRVR